MAALSTNSDEAIPNQDIEEMKHLLWGTDIKFDVFRRWTQGLVFSEDEPTALTQFEGGPCAVLAPLQAFLLKNALFSQNLGNNWRNVDEEQRRQLLCHAVAEMLSLVSSSDTVYLVRYHPRSSPDTSPNRSKNHPNPPADDQPNTSQYEAKSPPTMDQSPSMDSTVSANQNRTETLVNSESCGTGSGTCGSVPTSKPNAEETGSSPKKRCLSHEEFHLSLRCRRCNSREETLNQLQQNISELFKEYGVLLLLYSVLLTKGIEQIKNEVEDPGEPLIDGTFGHGSQSLINLLITGKAVSNVWDNVKDLSGLKLHGITTRAKIGFLTLLEHLRYCEVGWYLKNPHAPVWLLGSETHLTVLFSQEKSLVSLESPEAEARRIFNSFDTEGRGFIPCDHLQDLMGSLNLVAEPEYVKIMQDKLDPEQLGIVTLNSFMDEFFPHENQADAAASFTLMHYNGLGRSCPNGKVRYVSGGATILEMPDVQIITDTSVIKTCLMTKWPTIELKWDGDLIPSLN